jgi:GAF domain-containing protein
MQGGQEAEWQSQIEELTSALETLADAIEREDSLDALLQRVCQQVLGAIPGVDMAGVSLTSDGRGPKTAACTDEAVGAIDSVQYEAGMGPALHAAATGKIERVDVSTAQQRWPEFVRAAQQAGVNSYLSAPLFIDAEYSGALNLYSLHAHGYRELDAAVLELYTTAVESHLRTWRRYLATRRLTEQLRQALESRPVIERAKGILMVLHGISADQAFEMLVEQSQHRNKKLRDVAEWMVSETVAARQGGTAQRP